jgi:Domain of unknown function (DUF4349)
MEPRRDDLDLAAELRALRPSPEPAFAEALDTRAAAGFPRRGSAWTVAVRHASERFRATPPRRLLAPAGALAVAAVTIVTAVVVTTESEQSRPLSMRTDSHRDAPAASQGPTRLSEPAPSPSRDAEATGASGTAQYESAMPRTTTQSSGPGPYAARAGNRDVERAAQIVLGTEPAEIRTAAAKVFDAVHAVDGIVLDSSIRDGGGGDAGASFDLLIPSGKLGDALAAFSGIAEVRSRHETTRDITAPTVGIGERLQDSQARIEGLLTQLAGAETDGERAAVETELRAERRRAAALRSRLASLHRRANLSRVSLRIETGASAAADTGGSWGAGDALDDAGRILAVAAGIAVIGLAIVAPLALICLLAWLAHRWWVRWNRGRALG